MWKFQLWYEILIFVHVYVKIKFLTSYVFSMKLALRCNYVDFPTDITTFTFVYLIQPLDFSNVAGALLPVQNA